MAAPLIWPLIAVDRASPTFNRVAASADRAAVATERAGKAGAVFSTKMKAAFAGLAIADLGAHAIKMAADFQKSMLLIQTQAGASATEVRKMSSAVLSLSGRVATAPDQLATSLYHIESVGLRGAKALGVLKVAAEGAKVGNADLEQTTNALTSTVASGIKGVTNMQQAMGALNAIVGAGDMKLQDLNDALGGGILAIAKEYNVSLTQVGAALATFGDNNIRGADAATKLRMSIMDLAKPAAHADDFLGQIGLSAAKLRTDMGKGGLTGALDDLSRHMTAAGVTGGKVGAFLTDAFTKRAGAGLAVLIGQMQRYHTKLDEVAAGGNKFGAEWKATTQTASFAVQRLGAEFDVAAIAVGNKLLPAVTTAATWLGANLPRAMRALAAIITPTAHLVGGVLVGAWHGLLSVLGPVTHALGAVAHFLGNNSFAKGAVTSVLLLWGAFKGYEILKSVGMAVDLFFGRMIQRAVTAGATVRAFGAAMSGATLAIGGLVTVGVAVWQQMSAAAAKTNAAIQADVQSLTGTLNKQNAAITDSTRHWVEHRLAVAGDYDLANKLGVSFGTITEAALGNKAAIAQLAAANKQYQAGGFQLINQDQVRLAGILGLSGELTDAQRHQLQMNLADKQAAQASQQVAGANKQQAHAIQYLGGALRAGAANFAVSAKAAGRHALALRNDSTATLSLKQETDNLKGALAGLANRLSDAAAAVAWQQALNDLTTTFKQNKAALAGHSSAALADKAALIGDMQTIVQHAQSMQKNGASIRAVTGYISSQYGELRQHAIAAGADGKQVDALAKTLGAFPRQINAKISVDTSQAMAGIASVQRAIGNINGTVILHTTYQGGASSSRGASGRATGGGLPDGWTVVGEGGSGPGARPELIWKQGAAAHVFSHDQSKAIIDNTGMKVPGFAKGTQSTRDAAAASAVGSVGSLNVAKFTLGKIADYYTVMREIRHAYDVVDKNVTGKTAAHYKHLLGQYTREAKAQLITLTRQALAAPLQSQLTAVTSKLSAAQQRLAQVKQNFNQLAQTVSGAVGGFDVTTAGVGTSAYTDQPPPGISGGSILAQLTRTANQAKSFGGLLKKLSKEGLPKPLILQLAQAGPSAMPQAKALANVTPKQMLSIRSEFGQLTAAGNRSGQMIAGLQYGSAITSATSSVNGLVSQRNALKREIHDAFHDTGEELAKGFTKQLNKLGVDLGQKHYHTHIHGVHDPHAVGAVVERRLRMRAAI